MACRRGCLGSAALDHALAVGGGETGPRLARALGGFWLARGLFEEGQGWLERALATDSAEPGLRADLHRLLGALLFAAGDLGRAQATLARGLQIAAADPGLSSVQARIRVLRADIQAMQDGNFARAIEVCEGAAALLESEGDLEGVAEVWLSAGRLRSGVATPGLPNKPCSAPPPPGEAATTGGAGVQNLAGGCPLGPAHPV